MVFTCDESDSRPIIIRTTGGGVRDNPSAIRHFGYAYQICLADSFQSATLLSEHYPKLGLFNYNKTLESNLS